MNKKKKDTENICKSNKVRLIEETDKHNRQRKNVNRQTVKK